MLTVILIIPGLVFGADDNSLTGRLDKAAVKYGPFETATETTLATTLGLVIQAALSLLGVVFLIITILAGYKWMMAQGNEQEVEKAKESIKRSIIGLLITISAWAIWTFISNNFISQV